MTPYSVYDKTTQRNVNEIIANLNEDQEQLLADVINYGGWGTADAMFGDKAYMCDGYITDEAYRGGHFNRRSISQRLRYLYKALGMEGNKKCKQNDCMLWMYDWWEDGTGSILLIPEGLSGDFEEWAKQYKDTIKCYCLNNNGKLHCPLSTESSYLEQTFNYQVRGEAITEVDIDANFVCKYERKPSCEHCPFNK